jgi:uncharacterized protein with PIN domain
MSRVPKEGEEMLVCAKCNQQLRPKKNGVEFIETSQGEPIRLYSADLWECQSCGAEMLYTSHGQSPISE